jgi:hypothetical protein
MTPTFYRFAVRLYVTIEMGAEKAQSLLDTLIMRVDAQLDTSDGFGPSDWDVEYNEFLAAFIATNLLETGRED